MAVRLALAVIVEKVVEADLVRGWSTVLPPSPYGWRVSSAAERLMLGILDQLLFITAQITLGEVTTEA